MRSPSVWCLLVGLAGFAAATSESVRNGVHGARAGDIVISHATPIKGDALLIAVDHHEQDLASTTSTEEIPSEMRETEVASLVSHVVGALAMSAEIPQQVRAYPSSTILRKPRANLMIAVPDLGRMSLAEMELTHLQEMRQVHPAFTLKNTFEPRNTVSQLTTIVTGDVPSKHGIVGKHWRSVHGKVSAFEAGIGSKALLPTVADVVTHTFPQSVVVSVSGCKQLALAATTHNPTENTRTMSVDFETRSIVSSDAQPSSVDVEDISAFISSVGPNSVLYQFVQDGGEISMSADGIVSVKPFAGAAEADTVVFNVNKEADFKFFAELLAVDRTLAQVRGGNMKSLISDQHPDLYTFTLIGYHKISEEYGNDAQTHIAAKILDAVIPQINKQLATIYHGDLSSQIVLMGTPSSVHVGAVKKAVSAALGSSIASTLALENTFPRLYVEEDISHEEVQNLCSRVQKSVASFDLKADCIAEMTRPVFLQEKTATTKQDQDTTETTPTDIILYQINVWVSLLLLVLVLFALYPILSIDVTEGTFSSFLYAKKYV